MKYVDFFRLSVASVFVMAIWLVSCAERTPTEPRVPASQMESAKGMKAPFGETRIASPDIIAAGKSLYEGRAACFNCHGRGGDGKGPAATMLRPTPRDFTDCNWQTTREDGEIFWVISNGSPGTGMQSIVPAVLSKDEAWKVVAYLRTFCKTRM